MAPQQGSQRRVVVLGALIGMLGIAAMGWFVPIRAEQSAPLGADSDAGADSDGPGTVVIVWTSADAEVAHRMALMYTGAAQKNGWFDEVRLVVWGPSQKLVVADKDIRAKVEELRANGVIVEACLACADSYGVADALRETGMEVKYMGRPLTEWLKSDDVAVMTY